mgnify:CR=1 FL=1
MKENKDKKRVGILRGGGEDDHLSSIEQSAILITQIIENLSDKYKIVDVLVDRNGVWHINGIQAKPADLMHRVDVVWNTAQSSLSSVLKQFSISFVGVSSFAHSMGNNRTLLEQHIKDLDIKMPRHIVLPVYQKDFDGFYGSKANYANRKALEVFQKFAGPWIVRSLTENSNAGVHVAKTLPELKEAIEDMMKHGTSILVEELIVGKIVPVHSLRGFRGDLPALPNRREQARDIYTFPLVGSFSREEKEKISMLAKRLYHHLAEHFYLKSNFLLTPKGSVYLTGVFFNPNIKKTSHLSQSLESVGAKMHHLIEHILEQVS